MTPDAITPHARITVERYSFGGYGDDYIPDPELTTELVNAIVSGDISANEAARRVLDLILEIESNVTDLDDADRTEWISCAISAEWEIDVDASPHR